MSLPDNGTVIADAITVVICTFTAGQAYGSVRVRLKEIENRLFKIEGMFKLVLRDKDYNGS